MKCPICGRQTLPRYRPFCSKRCADIDLGRWLKGTYAIPAEEEDLTEEAAPGLAGPAEPPARSH
ncbi:MAG TPA: DNA gyrase inhibitor YacG [Paracoccaceae bacterium]|nr:DNA gyrase inhibitor YacG [Paracoccaceae bacterium]